jgi:ketosteroid isomerase-like protein
LRIPLLLLILLSLVACHRTPDEAQIRHAIDDMAQAVKRHDSGPVLDRLAPGFHGPEDMDVRQVRALLLAQYFRNPKIHVIVTGLRIHVVGDEADVVFHAAVAGGTGLLPQRGQYYAVTTRWRKIDGDWRVLRATWEAAGP